MIVVAVQGNTKPWSPTIEHREQSGHRSLYRTVVVFSTLRAASADCRWCRFFHAAQQTVLGQGRRSATVMLVGEQPGGQEDRAGKPFVGAAGKILHQALDSAQIEMDTVYISNAAHRQEELHLGDDIPVSRDPAVFATIHPSAILRGPPEQRRSVFDAFVRDFEVAVAH
ncbi:hypothetical protein KYT97_02160 [Rhodococcus globerulus]|nr:hypothetical protein KYT97_02160 [Rhodococcus globerulus]